MNRTHYWLSLLEGCFLVALGVHVLSASQLLISGTAGVGILLQPLSGLSFGQLFFVLNLPFCLLAWRYLGAAFTLRTGICVTLLAIFSEVLARYAFIDVAPVVAAIIGGTLIGFGLMVLLRQQASLGGINIFAVFLQEHFGIYSGKTLLVSDLLLGACALLVMPPTQVMLSVVAFVFMSQVVGRYHQSVAQAGSEA